jgi:hypothetical protein
MGCICSTANVHPPAPVTVATTHLTANVHPPAPVTVATTDPAILNLDPIWNPYSATSVSSRPRSRAPSVRTVRSGRSGRSEHHSTHQSTYHVDEGCDSHGRRKARSAQENATSFKPHARVRADTYPPVGCRSYVPGLSIPGEGCLAGQG